MTAQDKIAHVSSTAVLKSHLHAARYPSNVVVGLLLGQKDGENGILATDAVPLLHDAKPLVGSLELGMKMTQEHAKQTQKRLVGVYFSTNSDTPSTTTPLMVMIKQAVLKIQALNGLDQAFVLSIPSKFPTTTKLTVCLANPYLTNVPVRYPNAKLINTLKGYTVSMTPATVTTDPEASNLLKKHIQDKSFELVHDLDIYFDNPAADFLGNKELSKRIEVHE